MEFILHKFSEWLNSSNIPNTLIHVKGGFILENPKNDLKKLITSLTVPIDVSDNYREPANMVPMTFFADDGKEIIFTEKDYAHILNILYSALRDYIIRRNTINRRL